MVLIGPPFFSCCVYIFVRLLLFLLSFSFRLQVVFFSNFSAFSSSGGFVFPLVLRSGTKLKRMQKLRQTKQQEASNGPGQELANLTPHPSTTATTTIATVGPTYAFAAGIRLTSTSKAPAPPQSMIITASATTTVYNCFCHCRCHCWCCCWMCCWLRCCRCRRRCCSSC